MTVADLIAKLQKLDPALPVTFDDGAAENGDGMHACIESVRVETIPGALLRENGFDVHAADPDEDYGDLVVLAGVR